MNKKHKTNKKASWFVDNLGQLILMAIGIGVGIYFIWAYVLHGGGGTLNELQKCGSLTGNNGLCKETCDKALELELPNVGCKGLANKCCIPKDDNVNGIVLPAGYGGNDKYNFNIDSFYIDTNKGQVEGCEVTIDASRIDCTKGKEIKLPVIITISPTGTWPASIVAEPLIVLADNPNNVKNAVINPKTDTPIAGKVAGVVDVTTIETTITISATDSKLEDAYLKIYPYITCYTQQCKSDGGDTKGRGVKVSGETLPIVVTFNKVN